MSKEYLNVYNNLVKLTTNKKLYFSLKSLDTFSDRLTIFLMHFAFLLKNFKTDKNNKELQDLYDFIFRQIELSIREIGYGDQSINKKMKNYINFFHNIISDIHFWNNLNNSDKEKKISVFLEDFGNISELTQYFDQFNDNLSKKTLNSYLKSVSNQ